MSSPNKLTLITKLESVVNLDNRFENIQIINCERSTGNHKFRSGSLSVIFKAFDKQNNTNVAIKFFDPDISLITHGYRLDQFKREEDILKSLIGNYRHLQLIQGLKVFQITLSSTQGQLAIHIPYFVIEWIENDALDYFFNQSSFNTETKLLLFRKLCLSVFSLHRLGIYHRDIKPENIRIRDINKLDVVIIDLGTAALMDSPNIGSHQDYSTNVATPLYSPIEALCGLAGVRKIGIYSDIFSLGCMLYELFNTDYYSASLFNDSGFQNCAGVCQFKIHLAKSNNLSNVELLSIWEESIAANSKQVNRPSLNDPGNTVLPSSKNVLSLLLNELTQINYIYRTSDNNRVLRLIDAALRDIKVNSAYIQRKKLRQLYNMNKMKKLPVKNNANC